MNKRHDQALFILETRRKKLASTLLDMRDTRRMPGRDFRRKDGTAYSFTELELLYQNNIDELDTSIAVLKRDQNF